MPDWFPAFVGLADDIDNAADLWEQYIVDMQDLVERGEL